MGIAIVSLQAPQNLLSIPLPNCKTTQFHHGSTILRRDQPKPVSLTSLSFSSSSSWTRCSASVVEEEGNPAQPSSTIDDSIKPSLSGCEACGRDEVEKGCNKEGRIQGGIATFPGFGWWPIKAYRPCPGFLAAGGRYRRQGQSMDEVVSGQGKLKSSLDSRS